MKVRSIKICDEFVLREIVSVHIEDHGDIFGKGGFLKDVLDVVGKGAGLVGSESDLKTELIVGFIFSSLIR